MSNSRAFPFERVCVRLIFLPPESRDPVRVLFLDRLFRRSCFFQESRACYWVGSGFLAISVV
jgi:hypothetical protein